MSELSHFVVQQNIRRFSDQLRSETDATRRGRLQRLLVEGEDRLGFSVERLVELDRANADGDKRLEFQQTKIDNFGELRLRCQGPPRRCSGTWRKSSRSISSTG